MKQNVYSIRQGNRQYLSFLSTAAGLMADLDLGTEHLRWMGDSRFVMGYLQGGERPSHDVLCLELSADLTRSRIEEALPN